jgi:hypothetical protein
VAERSNEQSAFPEPPKRLAKFEANTVVALLDNPDQAQAAVNALAEAGFDPEETYLLCGQKGAERLDVSGRHHGLRGRVYRLVEWLSDEKELLFAAQDHLASGGLAIRVPAEEDRKANAARILGAHGAHGIVHFGRDHFEPLGT